MRFIALSLLTVAPLVRAELPIHLDPPAPVRPPGIVVPPPVNPTTPPKPPTPGAAVALPGELRLTVSLTDGSKLIGATPLKELALRSEALGALNIPLTKIRQAKVTKTGAVELTLRNGDRLQASLTLTKLPLVTVFGAVQAPCAEITAIVVDQAAGAGAQAVEWDAVGFPRDSDWPGPRGERAVIEDGEIRFAGQPVYSRGSFRGPVTIEFEVKLDARRSPDGALWVFLCDENEPTDVAPREHLLYSIGYAPRGQGKLEVGTRRDGAITATPINLPVGEWIAVRLELQGTTLRLTALEKEAVAENVKAPFERFRLRLQGWQATNTWRVRNVVVR